MKEKAACYINKIYPIKPYGKFKEFIEGEEYSGSALPKNDQNL
jgi:hypothetical protein